MNTEDNDELDEIQKVKRGGVMAMVKWPLITTAAIIAFIWIVFSILPVESGWRFGIQFKLLFSLFAIVGGLFFIFLKVGPLPQFRTQWKAFASIASVYLVTIGALGALGFALPQYELPKEGDASVILSAPERGQALFNNPIVGCYLCHTIGSSGGAGGQVRGPDLSKIGEVGADRVSGLSLKEYLRESILAPIAYIVPDYPPIMPTNFGDQLTEEQIEDLTTFLKSLGFVSEGLVEVALKDFSLEPDQLTVKAGKITFVLINEGRYTHDFRVEGQGVDEKAPKVPVGREFRWELNLEPGEYIISCPISDHDERGMVGTLVVVE